LDRLLSFFDESTSRYKQLKRQRDNLSDVILYEQIVKETDSILEILTLSDSERLNYFQKYIDEKQQRAKEALLAAEERKRFQLLGRAESSFYFYNPNLIAQGRQNYLALWGNRPNVDNWRSAFAIESISQLDTLKTEASNAKTSIIKETPESFVASLPQTSKEQDSIKIRNHNAYLQLGMIYKEKFKNYSLAQDRLEHLISQDLADELKVQAVYHLYRMAAAEDSSAAEYYKTILLEDYPETPFAQLISNPENFDNSKLITPETLYKNVLDLYRQQKFEEAVEAIEPLMILASGSSVEPKTALLKAHITGRLNGVEEWKTALGEVITNYSATEEAKNASDLLSEIEAYDDLKETGTIYKNYKWIFPFLTSDKDLSQAFFEEIKKVVDTHKQRWSVSLDPFNREHTFVVIHGIRDLRELENIEENSAFSELLSRNNENFVALSAQYRTIIKNKNWKTLQDERIRN
jgi:hypothetical protein